jgi:uncharacterized membrane protein
MDEQKKDEENKSVPVVEAEKVDEQSGAGKQEQNQQQQTQEEKKPTPNGIDEHKALAIVGYILPFLFFIPLLDEKAKKSSFAKFHANQQLNLLIFSVAAWFVSGVLAVIIIGALLGLVVTVLYVVLVILGIINSSNGEEKELPVIGGIRIMK